MIKKILHKFLGTHPNAMSFQNSMDLAELPVVTFHQGDKKINFLLDTGAIDCIIDSTYLKNLDYKETNMQANLAGLEGKKEKVKFCILKMSYKDREYEYPYIIRDMSAAFNGLKADTGVLVHGILGSKFFNKFKYVLDFDELIAYSKE